MKKAKEKKENNSGLIVAGLLLVPFLIYAGIKFADAVRKHKQEEEIEKSALFAVSELKKRSIGELTALQEKLSLEERFEDAAVVRDIIARKIKEQKLKQSKA